MDRSGREIIPPQFDDALEPRDDAPLLAVTQGGECYHVNRAGEMVMVPESEHFPRGDMASVVVDDKVGFVDAKGRMVIEPRFDVLPITYRYGGEDPAFFEGLAAVRLGDKVGFIDKTGEMVIELNFDGLQFGFYYPTFSEGLAALCIDRKWGFIDKTGRMVIPPQFDTSEPWNDFWSTRYPRFIQGRAQIFAEGKWGSIDNTGRVVIKPRFAETYDFHDSSMTAVAFDWRAVTPFPRKLPLWRSAWCFIDSHVCSKFGVCLLQRAGFINTDGDIVIPPWFDYAFDFVGDLAAVRIGLKWGFIDRTGSIVIKPRFSYAIGWGHGLARVWEFDETKLVDGRWKGTSDLPDWSYFDTSSGEYVWRPGT